MIAVVGAESGCGNYGLSARRMGWSGARAASREGPCGVGGARTRAKDCPVSARRTLEKSRTGSDRPNPRKGPHGVGGHRTREKDRTVSARRTREKSRTGSARRPAKGPHGVGAPNSREGPRGLGGTELLLFTARRRLARPTRTRRRLACRFARRLPGLAQCRVGHLWWQFVGVGVRVRV